jgi:2-oxoisovalerate dehydrogenase E1 component beta subunit
VVEEHFYDLAVRPRVLCGKHLPGIGLNQVYEWNEVPQLPDVLVAMRDLATEPA